MEKLVTKDFVVHYDSILQEFIERTVLHAEKKKKEFCKLFNCKESKIDVLKASFFVKREEFVEYIKKVSNGHVPPNWATGCFYNNEIQVLVNLDNQESKMNTLAHETLHLFFEKTVYQKYKIDRVNWLDESFAVYLDGNPEDISDEEFCQMIDRISKISVGFDMAILADYNKVKTKEYDGYEMFNIIGRYIFENGLENKFLDLLKQDRNKIVEMGKYILQIAIDYFQKEKSMVLNEFESERLVFKRFSELDESEINTVGDSWANPFNARYNAMRDPYGSAKEMCTWNDPTDWDNYYRVAFLKETGEIVGTCRFGRYHNSPTNDCWDFGFNVLLKHWFKGYGAEMVGKIIEIAKSEGVKEIRGGADIENYGSYKAMVKNGFEYVGIDEDGDYEYFLDLTKEPISKEKMEQNWQEHIQRTIKDFGEEKFQKLSQINEKIAEMVKRIGQGEDEQALTKQYFEELNKMCEFKFC